jgi:transposase
MGKPYSMDLRERVVAAVKVGGLSCNKAAKQFAQQSLAFFLPPAGGLIPS